MAGLAISALLLGRAAAAGATLSAYRGYFLSVLGLLLPLLAVVWRIPPLRAADAARG